MRRSLLLPLSLLFLLLHLAAAKCLPQQSISLLLLKRSLSSPPELASWRPGSDCCQGWARVTCDAALDNVVSLDLSQLSLSGEIDASLFNLTRLLSLDLSCNNLLFTSSSFERLSSLTHLNLSDSGFSGEVPPGISSLRRLISLDLSAPGRCSESSLSIPDLSKLIKNLSELKSLYLDNVNISSSGRVWGEAISSSLPKLAELSMYGSSLSGPIDESLSKLKSLSLLRLNNNKLNGVLPEFFADFSSLRLLKLSSSGLRGRAPERILRLPSLESLDLSGNPSLSGGFPSFPPGMALQEIILSNTNFSGGLPESISNLRFLRSLNLAGCRFSGKLPSSLGNLSRLLSLDLSNNDFSGEIPSLERLPAISSIDLQNNSFSGLFPSWAFLSRSLKSLQLSSNLLSGSLGEVPSAQESPLETLDLSSNNISGPVPSSLVRLKRLKVLRLADNALDGTVELSLFSDMKNLSILDLSHNRLTVVGGAAAFPAVSTLAMASCGLGSFPPQLQNLKTLTRLDLSGNKVNGQIPSWLWDLSSLVYLNLSHNALAGFSSLPEFPPSSPLIVLDLSSNNLSGPIPLPPPNNLFVDFSLNGFSSIPPQLGSTLNYTVFLSLSTNLLSGEIPASLCQGKYIEALDLSDNALSGPIPGCLFSNENSLTVLNLKNNNLNGTIPASSGPNCELLSLNLNGNNLVGPLPRSLKECSKLEVVDIGNNAIQDGFPLWLGSLSRLRVLVLRSNRFFGPLPDSVGPDNFSLIRIMDLSSNDFAGSLPGEFFKSLTAMAALDESSPGKTIQAASVLTGVYYEASVTVSSKGADLKLVKILKIFASLDLSENSFKGSIPAEVTSLKALKALNMARNSLSGEIPSSVGELTSLESLDLSWNSLSGRIPPALGSIPFLSFLNLSFNNLTGRIPTGPQLQTLTERSYLGNPGLCGKPLAVACSAGGPAGGGADSGGRFNWKYILAGVGYGGGLALVFFPFVAWGEGRRWCSRRLDGWLGMARTESGEGPSQRRFCVFCTRLEFSGERMVVRHDPCTCDSVEDEISNSGSLHL